MPNFGVPRRATQGQREEHAPLNLRRGLFRIWVLVSAGWIMGWTIYLILENVHGGFSTSADFVEVLILLLAPPVALFLFGLAGGWAMRGFEPDK